MSRTLLTLALTLSLYPRTSAAQAADSTNAQRSYAVRAMARLEARMSADSGLQLVLSANGGSMMESFTPAAFRRLNDSVMVRFAQLTDRSLGMVNAAICSAWMGGETAAFMEMLERSDSGMVDEWLSLIEGVLYAQAMQAPLLPSASDSIVAKSMTEMILALPPKERQRVLDASNDRTPASLCMMARLAMRYIGKMPRSEAGPILRSMFAAANR